MLKPRFDPFRFTRPLIPSQEQRRKMIADAAYYHAQRRDFQPGFETADWLAAEAEVDHELSFRRLNYGRAAKKARSPPWHRHVGLRDVHGEFVPTEP